jgi:hypothetical protein
MGNATGELEMNDQHVDCTRHQMMGIRGVGELGRGGAEMAKKTENGFFS